MNKIIKTNGKRMTALMLVTVLVVSMFSTTALAVQEDSYHDPAEHWLSAVNRTNELDANATVTSETFNCSVCKKPTSFTVWRTPEYSKDGKTALSRNVKFSDGTCIDEESVGVILDGTPGVDAYYTGYHWTKAMCDICGTMHSNGGGYKFGKNIYYLYDCSDEFIIPLPETVTCEYADSTYHTKVTKGGSYCGFCFGTNHKDSSVLEKHMIQTEVLPQISNNRFAIVKHCTECDYVSTEYVAAKSVVADYYGVVDGKAHTLTVSDLSENGVSVAIRYGNSAESCNMTAPPAYTEEGQYTVYYKITYTYGGESMVEDGVSYVWLRDEKEPEHNCPCGCGMNDCNCGKNDCGNGGCTCGSCAENHNFVIIESIKPTCKSIGYDRYVCVNCGKVEKRDYVEAIGHAWQTIVIRDATCEVGGKTLKVCKNCGECEETTTPKGEHKYTTYKVKATCVNPGYTVKECSVCGERQITDITNAKPHDYKAIMTPANCENDGHTTHICMGCGSSFVTDYTEALGHSFDKGTVITNSSCTGEGVTEFRCERCGYHYVERNAAEGHIPGDETTCTAPQLCTKCGAVIVSALGHSFNSETVAPTCRDMGYTTYTCEHCGESYKSDYVQTTGHKLSDWIIDKKPTTGSEGSKHKECLTCGEKLETATIEKLYLTATTDSKGEAVVGGYLVVVTDTDTTNPVANVYVALKNDGTIAIRLPNSRLIDYDDKTTVQVMLVKDKSPVSKMLITVTDKNSNYAAGVTDKGGQVTIPGTTGTTDNDGKATVGYRDKDDNRLTITVKVEDNETGRPIEDAAVSIGKTGTITVVLPDGTEMDENNRILIIVTDNSKNPLENKDVIVKGDLGQNDEGKTDEDGKLIVPAVTVKERHTAYITGFPDGTFEPEKNMTRSEAAAIFARLLAAKNGDTLREYGSYNTKFTDVPANAWYAGSVKYLTRYGVTFGYGGNTFVPERPITRAEFTAMAVRFFDVYGEGDAEIIEKYAKFNDVSEGYWAAKYIKDAAIHGWVFGYGDGTFGAEKSISRAEVVSIVNRLLGWNADKSYVNKNIRKLTTFSDMTSKNHWAYYAIMEAANTHTATIDGSEIWSK